jgi:hypothetical protein
MPSANEVLESSFIDFKERQPPGLFEKFQETGLLDVQVKILDIQMSQERQKSLTDFSRTVLFINAFREFAETFRLTRQQTACVWGPLKYVLHVNSAAPILQVCTELTNGIGSQG